MKTYTGFLDVHDYGESDDVLFLSSIDEPLAEELEWMCDQNVTVKYWITDEEVSKDEAQEKFLNKIMGFAVADFSVHYGDWTGYLWTDEDLNVGGHDLLEELKFHDGQFLILEIEQHTE